MRPRIFVASMMNNEDFGIGLVGLGLVGREHAKGYLRNPRCRIRALCSRTEENGRRFAHELGLQQAYIYTDLSQMLARNDVHVVSICTPNSLHVDQGIAVARAGKHLVLEKPIAVDWPDALRLAREVQSAKIKSIVALVLHWYPRFLNQAALVRAGAIGDVFLVDCEYLHGHLERYPTQWRWSWSRDLAGGTFLQGGIHAVDAMCSFIDSNPVEVTAYGHRHLPSFEYEPTIVGIVRFANGAVAKITSSFETAMPYQLNLRLYGTCGTIQNAQLWSEVLLPGQNDWASTPGIGADSGDPSHHPFAAMIDDFVNCLVSGREPFPSVSDALRSHEIAVAAALSAARGMPVQLPLEKRA